MAKSLIDYIFRFLGARFLAGEARAAVGLVEREEPVRVRPPGAEASTAPAKTGGAAPEVRAVSSHPIGFMSAGSIDARHAVTFSPQADAPSCSDCGALMVRNGSCYKCFNCG